MNPSLVAIQAGISGYPSKPPFHPDDSYPEAPYRETVSASENPVYAGVRKLWCLLGLDREHFGTPAWNPLGAVVHPGDLVVLKPNLVRHWNGAEDTIRALVTHGSVVRAVADYVLIALKGQGSLVVGDAPVQETDFEALTLENGLKETMDWLGAHALGPAVSLVDWRKERAHCLRSGTILGKEALPGDPRGFVEVDLEERSFLNPIAADAGRFRVTNYDRGAMARVHTARRNSYLISGSVLQADAVITLPKMKPHGKAGITCALKNNVGINGHKDWLPHHREGSREEGGDEYEHKSLRKRWLGALSDLADRAHRPLSKQLFYYLGQAIRKTGRVMPCKDPFLEGSWYGNDTVWRMCLDLNRILFFVDAKGKLQERQQRRYLGLVDGVVAGEGNGPLHVTSKQAGVLVAGFNPVPIDLCCCRLMGFDEQRIPLLAGALESGSPPALYAGGIRDIQLAASEERYTRLFDLPRQETLCFLPPVGWRGHVELGDPDPGPSP